MGSEAWDMKYGNGYGYGYDTPRQAHTCCVFSEEPFWIFRVYNM